ncbi:MAG: hypothetical protein QOC62_1596 [Mycobacterium sp.]|jgi:hypothetical protein|nr:hypothetical protein [Mycobacterium sp.]
MGRTLRVSGIDLATMKRRGRPEVVMRLVYSGGYLDIPLPPEHASALGTALRETADGA